MAYTTYTTVGPFNDNNPPGLNAAFFNALEAFLAACWADSSITSNGAGVLTVLGLTANGTTTINGNETVSGTLIVTGAATLSASGTGLSVSHNASVGGTLAVAGAATLSASGTGLTVSHNATVSGNLTVGGSLNLSNGSITAMNGFGSIALTTSQATYNHGLGVVPDIILLSPDGTSSTARTWQVDYGTLTSSTFKATGGSSFNAVGVAIKF